MDMLYCKSTFRSGLVTGGSSVLGFDSGLEVYQVIALFPFVVGLIFF